MSRSSLSDPSNKAITVADSAFPTPTNSGKSSPRRLGLHRTKSRRVNVDAKPVFRSVRSVSKSTLEPVIRPQPLKAGKLALAENPKTSAPGHINEARTTLSLKSIDGTLNIYTDHFGLNSRPFTLVPDADFIYWSTAHRRAFTMLEYGISTGAPITLITGEIGAGKTTMLRNFLKGKREDVTIGLISNSQGSRGELLRWVLMALDQTAAPDATYVDLFEVFQKYLISEYAAGKRVILIFDEAQNLSIESLEELRMFTNINSNKDELLQLVLLGQPDLRETIRRPALRQFAQRVAASFHLGTLNQEQVAEYIFHRLRVAGSNCTLFSKDACKRIYEKSGGVPRLVNQLCDLAMVYAFSKNQMLVSLATVDDVLADGLFFYTDAFPEEA